MKPYLFFSGAVAAVAFFALKGQGQEPASPAATPSTSATAEPTSSPRESTGDVAQFMKLAEMKWEKILPDLGENSPQICILRVDPKTQATQLLIRTPKAIHIRKHWHSANETHTIIIGNASLACDGKRVELEPGSFNYMPAKMVHEAWLPANSLTFITVDGPWDVNWTEGPPTSADLSRSY